jgi:aldose sugar dehydrogenase
MLPTALLTCLAWLQPSAATLPAGPDFSDRSPAGIYAAACSNCHGANLEGGNGSSLIDGEWHFGDSRTNIFRVLKFGIEDVGMPAFAAAFTDPELQSVATFILQQERAAGIQRGGVPTERKTQHYTLTVDSVVDQGLQRPWSIAFLSPTHALITERPGRLRVWKDGNLLPEPVTGLPSITENGQGGLMDVALDPEFATQPWVYLAYTDSNAQGRQTRVVRGKIIDNRWTDNQDLFVAKPETYSRAGVHFGSRIVFDSKNRLYFSIGDRGNQNTAQSLSSPQGKVHRINRDGSIPDDNPFLNTENALPTIYSFGHRNIQGMAFLPNPQGTEQLWTTEHGPLGGDELNLTLPGRNYGWPVITYGRNYNGTPVSNLTAREGMEQPAAYWVPSRAVCGLDFASKSQFPLWRTSLLSGGLATKEVRRVQIDAEGKVIAQEVILQGAGRVRDVVTGPDGAVYVVLNDPDVIIRLANKAGASR